jgi:hypothetical protein
VPSQSRRGRFATMQSNNRSGQPTGLLLALPTVLPPLQLPFLIIYYYTFPLTTEANLFSSIKLLALSISELAQLFLSFSVLNRSFPYRSCCLGLSNQHHYNGLSYFLALSFIKRSSLTFGLVLQ